MKKIDYLIIISAALFFCANVQGQEGKISGFIKSQDNKAVEAATVTLVKAKDTSIVKIAVTDKAGLFEFEKIKNDNYLLKVDAIGYNKLTGKPFALTAIKQTVNAGDIQLTPATQSLNNVSVSATRPLVETRLIKLL
jgi:iron complex outermembrane receptor protein